MFWGEPVMPVQIGAQAHNFSDPTGLLSACHRRIEIFLRVLEGVASVIDRPMTEETRASLESGAALLPSYKLLMLWRLPI